MYQSLSLLSPLPKPFLFLLHSHLFLEAQPRSHLLLEALLDFSGWSLPLLSSHSISFAPLMLEC